jgi:hypothetical protein
MSCTIISFFFSFTPKLNSMDNDYADALKEEIKEQIVIKTKDKMKIQSSLLLSDSAESRANQIISKIRSTPAEIDSIDDFDFRGIFSRVIVKNKEHLIFVIGNDNVSDLKLTFKTLFNSKVEYKVRRTTCISNFGILINR